MGYILLETQYDDEHWGNWWIICQAGDASFRVLWDGRDRWLNIQRPATFVREGFLDKWQDAWVGKQPSEQTPEQIIVELGNLRGVAPDGL